MKQLIATVFVLGYISTSWASTTINATNKFSYGANTGWVNWHANGTNGAVIGEFVCSDYIYSANCGWIHLGDGSPDNGIQYSNTSATDFGVNHIGAGQLRGFAYGANIGWLNFEAKGNPRVNLQTGVLEGSVWSANTGWISLSNAVAFVKTDSIANGVDSDADGIADGWEIKFTGDITTLSDTADLDGDGSNDLDEYEADSNPLDPTDSLRIVFVDGNIDGSESTLTWKSTQTREYLIQSKLNLDSDPWVDHPTGIVMPDQGMTTTRTVTDEAATTRFFRIQAKRPLSP